jgi:hypothetical protein
MKLKLVVASMSVLGLISCPVLAATHAKHRHHVAHRHHVVTSTTDYKAMGALPVQPAPVVETCPLADPLQATLDAMGQNTGRAKPTEDCNKLISFAGGANFDGKWGNRSMGYQGVNNQRLSLNDVYLNIIGNVNDWSKAFASISYGNPSAADPNTKHPLGAYSNVYKVDSLNLEQGFIRFANFDQSPVFAQLGKQFQPFGRYQIHALTRSLAQSLSESLKTSAEVGFVSRTGVNGAVYAFDNSIKERTAAPLASSIQGHTKTVYGAELGFAQPNDQLGYDLGVGYMSNMTGVNDIAQAVSNFNGNRGYNNRVGGIAVFGDMNSGPFTVGAHYVTAIQRFNGNDLLARSNNGVNTRGAKPWAGDVQVGFGFNNMLGLNNWTKTQNVYVGYQASGDAVNISLPKNRWVAGYGVDMWKNANIGLEVTHDTDYSTTNGGSGSSSNTIGVRASVKFG